MITSKTGKATSKAKISLGIAEDDKVIWIPLDLPEEENSMLKAWNQQLNIESHGDRKDLYTTVAKRISVEIKNHWFNVKKEEISGIAEKYDGFKSKSPEDLAKEYAATTNKLKKLETMLAAMKAAAGEKAPKG